MWQILDTIPGCDLAIFCCAYLAFWTLGVTAGRVANRDGRFQVVPARHVGHAVGYVKVGSPHPADSGVTVGLAGTADWADRESDLLGARI